MNFMNQTPMLTLTAASGSFPFQPKYIPLAANIKVILGREDSQPSPCTDGQSRPRAASATNGWFAATTDAKQSNVTVKSTDDLPLSATHAEVWSQGGQIFIKDLRSSYGTYVNDVKIQKETRLRTGDIICLGSPTARTTDTPAYITDAQLKPVVAKVTLVGASSQ